MNFDLKKIRTKLRSTIICLEAHPDNTYGSEFEDRINDLQEIVDQIDVVILGDNLTNDILSKNEKNPKKIKSCKNCKNISLLNSMGSGLNLTCYGCNNYSKWEEVHNG